ncbi:hypothetical protein GCM10007275_11370 [Jeotgalicoccus coquinae]|uniref:DUF5067 domain-containing protein n=1 Tax=Jeotgalicoccus coquinae TaxID=709509 RepID=A0A6V7RNV5_9STAP|nr:hypothetical protein [Jeotgalicoccus coquinae]MBB6422195.1 hypothetical protein [Jeotgalicoccus coquinae]GGE17885.1 hypothetical protein GCM10007275_11370 [Jeotgalicoccus coquinae]CAD2079334.1 hypothetical protein JEOCOQ751_01462 [Jeotgalicoccus coquinae]
MQQLKFSLFLIGVILLAGCGQTSMNSEEVLDNVEEIHNNNLEIVSLLHSNDISLARELVTESNNLLAQLDEDNNVNDDSEQSIFVDYSNYISAVKSYYQFLDNQLGTDEVQAELIFFSEEWLKAQQEITQTLSDFLVNNFESPDISSVYVENVDKESYFNSLNVILTHFFAITEHHDSGAEHRKYNENNLMWNEVRSVREKLLKETQDLDFIRDLQSNISEFGAIASAVDIDDWDTIINELSGDAGFNTGQIIENYYGGEYPEGLSIYFDEQAENTAEITETDVVDGVEDSNEESADQMTTYSQGEWWEISDEWRLKINQVYSTDERNQFSDKNPEQVVIINYTYENLGFEGSVQDLYLTPYNVIDSEGVIAETYPTSGIKGARPAPIGSTMEEAEVSYGLSNSGGEIQIVFEKFDTSRNKHTGVFSIEIK